MHRTTSLLQTPFVSNNFRFEWSVGYTSGTFPDGIYSSVDDRVWHDAGQLTSATFSSEYGKLLNGGQASE